MINVITVEFESALPTVKPPTFLDVGVSQAYLPWERRLDVLLHTPQATANLIEASIWDDVNHTLIPELAGLPFVEIYTESGQYVASTLDLPHRLGTGYLLKNKHAQLDGQRFREGLRERIRSQGVYQAAFALCPMSIVLGSFYTHIAGVYRIPRVLSGEFVAENAVSMPTGGAVHDPVSARGMGVNIKHMFAISRDKKGEKDKTVDKPSQAGLGNIVYVRESFKAERYVGRFVIDTRLVDKSNLDAKAKHLIQVLSEYLVRRLLSEPVTLRTECYLTPVQETAMRELPGLADLETQVNAAIQDCADLFDKVRVVVPDDQVHFDEVDEDTAA
ncbi:MAG: type I-U CRISPR-associated protein Cas7 [Leptolyngbya sp. SIO1D8]|nr:type I-U CRISPR-associated protein Cas7 [Leptolyngbya sp. SIO1D8]